MQLVVGRIIRPHGVRGELAVEVRTDDPELRLATGAVLATQPAAAGPLTVTRARWHTGKLLLTFDGVADRDGADGLRGVRWWWTRPNSRRSPIRMSSVITSSSGSLCTGQGTSTSER